MRALGVKIVEPSAALRHMRAGEYLLLRITVEAAGPLLGLLKTGELTAPQGTHDALQVLKGEAEARLRFTITPNLNLPYFVQYVWPLVQEGHVMPQAGPYPATNELPRAPRRRPRR